MVYYAHSMRKYSTRDEFLEYKLIAERYVDVYNPNCHEISRSTSRMKACFRVISRPEVTALVFSECHGHIGRGVYDEIRLAQKLHKPIYLLREGVFFEFHGSLRMVDAKDWAVNYAKVVL